MRVLKAMAVILATQFILVASADAAGTWHMRNSNASPPATDFMLSFGNPGEHVVTGDWDGNGTDTIGTFLNGSWYLTNFTGPPLTGYYVNYGQAGDIPVPGNWAPSGLTDSVGVFRAGNWHQWRTDLGQSITFGYGSPDDKPFKGDYLDTQGFGPHTDEVGTRDATWWSGQSWWANVWHRRVTAAIPFPWADHSDTGFYGDWNGDGVDTPGIYRPSDGSWHLSNDWDGTPTAYTFTYGGLPGDKPVFGDWNGDGIDTVGIVRGL
jgi:serine-aspartate repeat-containing protein C/D/E